jgi:hypothetical protein
MVAAAGLLTWAVALAPGIASAAVSSTPDATPQIGGSATSGTDGTIEQVRQIVQCGTTMYAGGTFTQVRDVNSTTPVTVGNAFAFSATTPHRLTAWNPNVNGTVNSVACDTDGSILLAGQFTQVGTTPVTNLAKVDATTGAVDPAFKWTLNGTNSPAGMINHIEVVEGHLLVGGQFKVTSTTLPSYLASVNPLTGRYDSYALPAISGNYVYTGVKTNTTKIFNMTVRPPVASDPNEYAILLTGVFTSVGGQHHEQVFRLNVPVGGLAPATLSAWSPADLYFHCSTVEPFYAQDTAWAPDGSKIYIASTGYKPYNGPNGKTVRTGPCDAAIAYNAEPQQEIPVKPLLVGGANVGPQPGGSGTRQLPNTPNSVWTNYTGCDSLYSIGADASTVYVAGHERFIDNPNVCDQLGSGGRAQPGLGELSVSTGHSVPGPNRGRGLGADDVLVTQSGLWIASDNQANTDTCSGKHGHMGICYLPFS